MFWTPQSAVLKLLRDKNYRFSKIYREFRNYPHPFMLYVRMDDFTDSLYQSNVKKSANNEDCLLHITECHANNCQGLLMYSLSQCIAYRIFWGNCLLRINNN